MTNYKFKYGQIAKIQKGSCGILVKVGIRFDSKVHCKRKNPSGISYYIEGYETRDWCFSEELKRLGPIRRFIIYIKNRLKKNDSK